MSELAGKRLLVLAVIGVLCHGVVGALFASVLRLLLSLMDPA